MKSFSNSALNIDGQPMFKVLDKVKHLESQGKKIYHFEIGDPDFGTPPTITEAACKSLLAGHTHYTSSYGVLEFRKTICDATANSRGFKPSINQVLVTPGANIAIFYAIYCLVNPGEEVIVPDPGFPTYYSNIKMCGAIPVRVALKEENGFRMNPDDIEKVITPKTRLLIINSPQNPTGSVMTQDEMKKIFEICVKHDIYLYSDEIYARMIYNDIKFTTPSIYDQCKERVIISNGFSKAFAMTGWRLGAVIGPEKIIERMAMLLQTTSSCVSPFIQEAGIEAIKGDQKPVQKMISEYQERLNIFHAGLNEIPGISCIKPNGAFYLFANIKSSNKTSEQIADYLLTDADVAVLPGTNFGIHGEGYIRLCYATSKQDIQTALGRIKTSMTKLVKV